MAERSCERRKSESDFAGNTFSVFHEAVGQKPETEKDAAPEQRHDAAGTRERREGWASKGQ